MASSEFRARVESRLSVGAARHRPQSNSSQWSLSGEYSEPAPVAKPMRRQRGLTTEEKDAAERVLAAKEKTPTARKLHVTYGSSVPLGDGSAPEPKPDVEPTRRVRGTTAEETSSLARKVEAMSLDVIRNRNMSTHWNPYHSVDVETGVPYDKPSSDGAVPFISPIKARVSRPDVGKTAVRDASSSTEWAHKVHHRAPRALKSDNLHAHWTLDGTSPPPAPAFAADWEEAGSEDAAAAEPGPVEPVVATLVHADVTPVPVRVPLATAASPPPPPPPPAALPAEDVRSAHVSTDGASSGAGDVEPVYLRPSASWYDTSRPQVSPRRAPSSITRPDQGYSPEFVEPPKTARTRMFRAMTPSWMPAPAHTLEAGQNDFKPARIGPPEMPQLSARDRRNAAMRGSIQLG